MRKIGRSAFGFLNPVSHRLDYFITRANATFLKPGRVGVWTKGDWVTYLDDLAVAPIAGGTP